jgi:uncharacterized protein YjbI with pentapeptide repeats
VVQFLTEADLITDTSAWAQTGRGIRRRPGLESSQPLVSLRGADLRDAVMPESLLMFTESEGPFDTFTIRAASLEGADLRGADFRDGLLIGVTFNGAKLGDADLRGANVGGASFYGSCLTGTSFVDAQTDVAPADFSFTSGDGVDFTRADLGGASFIGAQLAHVTLTGARTERTRWPPNWTETGRKMSDAEVKRLCRE